MQETVIKVKDFRKLYDDFVAVEDLSFEVKRGQIYGLLGPNGAGKTSTLESLEGLRTPDGGRLEVAGVDPSHDARGLRNVIGVQLQTSGLPANITVDEAMKFFCAYHGVEPNAELLVRLGLGEKRQTQYSDLSTGQQRRLALALALAHKPQVLFLDEPTAGLDVGTRVELHNLMNEEKQRGATILLATHDMAEAEEMSDHIGILLHGKLVASGTPMEITATGAGLTKVSVHTEQNCLAGDGTGFPAVESRLMKDEYHIFFSTDIGPTVGAIIQYVEGKGDRLIDLRVERPSLEDRFLEITAEEVAR